ncbi:MAG: LON peptidase substrate-binding domain-containing protein [Chloroflexota bacterium]|nr:LON peptidase substrate-binding domain-containing protein [Chloroflexota bacterium]
MTERLPIFPLHAVLFPGDLLPLHIFEPRYRLMLSRCAADDPCFGVVLMKSGSEAGDQPEIHQTGTSATVVEKISVPDGRSNILIKGARRFKVLESDWDESYMMANITWCDTPNSTDAGPGLQDAVGRIHDLLDRYLNAYSQATGQSTRVRDFGKEPIASAYAIASTLPMPLETRQRLLEATEPDQLLSLLEDTLRHETALLTRTGAYATLPGQRGARFTSN